MKKISAFLLVFTLWLGALSATAETITVGSSQAQPGQVILLPITVDVPGNIAGAVFTLSYNSSYFTLTGITSTFFDTFTNQWQALSPVPNPLPPAQVSVDGTDYSQPLLFNNLSGATLFAAARVKTGATQTTLCTLHFTLKANVPDGIYTVSISKTYINNTDAGYAATGEPLPILVGAIEGEQDLSLAYPPLATTLVNGVININTTVEDADGDGISDAWEITHFGNTTTANQISDYDKDGYTDLQEYLNQLASETDPAHNAYDPKIENAPNGTGFNSNSGSRSFWNIVLPAILNSRK